MNSNAGGRNKKRQRASKGGIGKHQYANKLRLAEDGEMYACVEKVVGNGRVAVIGIDGKPYSCVIRQKFKGRNKRDNMMTSGTWCLVAVREWETRQNDTAVCDLLHVYRDSDSESIRKKENLDFTALVTTEATVKNAMHTDIVVDDGIDFSHAGGDVVPLGGDAVEFDTLDDCTNVPNDIVGGDDCEIDFDDI